MSLMLSRAAVFSLSASIKDFLVLCDFSLNAYSRPVLVLILAVTCGNFIPFSKLKVGNYAGNEWHTIWGLKLECIYIPIVV